MEINLPLFTLIYIFIFCFMPIITVLKKAKPNDRDLILRLLFTLYLLICLCLTLFSVKISKTTLTFSYLHTKWFSFHLAFDLTLNNLIINFALVLPMGVFAFCFSKLKNMNFSQGFLLSVFFGSVFGVIIESLQGILPVLRSTDLCDVFYNTIFTVLCFTISYVLYNKKEHSLY